MNEFPRKIYGKYITNTNKGGIIIAVSKCLAGYPCRYDGGSKSDEEIVELVKSGKAVCICPEYLLDVPRNPCEITGGDGADVLKGGARVVDSSGEDKTKEFVDGAYAVLEYMKSNAVNKAILKARSPSCGYGEIYDGSFSGKCKTGNGVAAALFLENDIEIEAR